nr:unnamed protein product [Spirometra erinaceieuropaei]
MSAADWSVPIVNGRPDRLPFKLPEFWPQNVPTWFAAVEALFASERITSQWAKFSHLVFALPSDLSKDLCGHLLNSNSSAPYDRLKNAVLKITYYNTPPKIVHANANNKVPSEVLRQPRNSGSANNPNQSVIKQHFGQPTPHRILKALVPRQNEVPPRGRDYLSDLTTEINKAGAPTPVRTLSPESVPSLRQIQSDILRLQAQVATISTRRSRTRGRSLPRCHQRSGSRRGEPRRQEWCWYHRSFGANARMCTSPCQFNVERTTMAAISP